MIERPVATCPKCKRDDRLTVNVSLPAYMNCQVVPGADGTIALRLDEMTEGYASWENAQPLLDQLFCECGWNGKLDSLRRVGWDGKPLKKPMPGQLAII